MMVHVVISAFGILRHEDCCEFQASLIYIKRNISKTKTKKIYCHVTYLLNALVFLSKLFSIFTLPESRGCF